MTLEAQINYFDDKVTVVCDARCDKAWGHNNRPKIEFNDDDPDDYAYLADHELGVAPVDPGTYEGGHGKPETIAEFPNKWCVRECERCGMLGARHGDYPASDFSVRVYNQPSLHEDDLQQNSLGSGQLSG